MNVQGWQGLCHSPTRSEDFTSPERQAHSCLLPKPALAPCISHHTLRVTLAVPVCWDGPQGGGGSLGRQPDVLSPTTPRASSPALLGAHMLPLLHKLKARPDHRFGSRGAGQGGTRPSTPFQPQKPHFSLRFCSGLNSIPLESTSESQPPEAVKVTSFGKRVFADVTR